MIKFEVKYYGQKEGEPRKYSHSYDEVWEPTEYFCPCCGQKPVWHDTSGGDYYVRENFMCVSCGAAFHLPNGADPSNNEQDKQRLEELRKVATAAPPPEVEPMAVALARDWLGAYDESLNKDGWTSVRVDQLATVARALLLIGVTADPVSTPSTKASD